MSHKTKIAIVIPCWNCEKEIKEMLDSIILQTFQDWQVFCVDDQSTDKTLKVLEDYSQKDNRINFILRPRLPKGAQTCRNVGLELSKDAEYICFFDSDDIIAPYCLKQRIQFMDNHPNLDFGIFPAKTFHQKKWEETNTWFYGFPFFKDSLVAMLSWTLPMVGWTNIYRRSSLIKYQHKWDEKILSLQDSDFNLQSILKGMKYDYAYSEGANIDYFYRVNNSHTSISKKIETKEHYISHLYLFSKTMNSFSNKKEKEYYRYMKVNSLLFANLIKDDKDIFRQFLNLPWIRKHKILKIRFHIWQLFHYHFGERFLLKNIFKDKRKMSELWKIANKNTFQLLNHEHLQDI